MSPEGSPFPGAGPKGAPCNGVPAASQASTSTNYPGTEVEPWLAVNPANNANLVTGWQQDRWSDGGSNSVLFGYSVDGGSSLGLG